jgi:uncharacterized protein (DUF2147 family)
MKTFSLTLSLIYFLCLPFLLMGEEITGFWKTINDKTGKAQSIIAIYGYQGKYYGRIIATYNRTGNIQDTIETPKARAEGVEGHPFYSGLDIIWDLKPNGNHYSDGKILDPEKGRLYDAEVWRKNDKLIVRGEVWVFGENEEWEQVADTDFPPTFTKPDFTKFVPSIPKRIQN